MKRRELQQERLAKCHRAPERTARLVKSQFEIPANDVGAVARQDALLEDPQRWANSSPRRGLLQAGLAERKTVGVHQGFRGVGLGSPSIHNLKGEDLAGMWLARQLDFQFARGTRWDRGPGQALFLSRVATRCSVRTGR